MDVVVAIEERCPITLYFAEDDRVRFVDRRHDLCDGTPSYFTQDGEQFWELQQADKLLAVRGSDGTVYNVSVPFDTEVAVGDAWPPGE